MKMFLVSVLMSVLALSPLTATAGGKKLASSQVQTSAAVKWIPTPDAGFTLPSRIRDTAVVKVTKVAKSNGVATSITAVDATGFTFKAIVPPGSSVVDEGYVVVIGIMMKELASDGNSFDHPDGRQSIDSGKLVYALLHKTAFEAPLGIVSRTLEEMKMKGLGYY